MINQMATTEEKLVTAEYDAYIDPLDMPNDIDIIKLNDELMDWLAYNEIQINNNGYFVLDSAKDMHLLVEYKLRFGLPAWN